MGLDITVCRCHMEKCPHCGKPIRGTILDQVDSCGRFWSEYLEKIGYYVPYEIREKEPERDFYGKDMTLKSEQTKDLATFAREHELYNWVSIMALVDCAIENGDFVVINADW
jgi:hypothetical protein|nr:MAG TPA: zinc finger domain protein [Caudoviricetes sp.]